MKRRTILATPLLAALAVTGLSACGSDSAGTGSATGSTTTLPKSSMNPVDRDKISDGGNFTYPISSFAETWNSMDAAGNEVDYTTVRGTMSARFINTNESGEYEIDKNWCDDITGEEKDGKTVVTIKMNPKAKWNDGAAFTLADWTNTIKAGANADKKFNVASTEGYDQIEKVEQGGDANTFVITFKSTYSQWRGLVAGGPARAESVKDADTFNKGWADLKKASDAGWFSGPFIVDKIDKGKSVIVKRNPNWWGETPKLQTVTFIVQDPTSNAAAFLNGQVDAFDIGVNADNYAKAQSYTEGEIRRSNSLMWRHFTFNTKAASLQDKAVRRAIVQYLDRAQIAKSDMAGMGLPEVTPLNNHSFMQDQAPYKDMAEETGLKFDQAAAEKTMTDAGYAKDSTGIWAKDGKQVAIKFTTLTGVKVSENEGKQFQDQMAKFGIKVTMAPVPSDQMSPTLDKRAFEVIAFTWAGTPYPYGAINQFFNPSSSSNYSGMDNAEVVKLINTISTEMDDDKRNQAVTDAEKIVWEDPQILPLYQRPQQYGVKKGLANFGAYGLITPWSIWENVGWVK